MAGKTRSQPLPRAEDNLFKQVVKFYEAKQFKKAIKLADQILKKVPDHGETLAMKALIVHNLPDRSADAHALARAALKADIRSYVCWHVFGILHRSERSYEQAAACYSNALARDPDNLNISRDLATLQLQLRDVPALVGTAGRVLGLKSNMRQHWALLAVAHALAKNYSVAVGVLDAFLSTQDLAAAQRSPVDRYEQSEVIMFKAELQRRSGDLIGATHTLMASDGHICDRLGRLQMLAELALGQGDRTAAERHYRALIVAVPDNYEWHHGLCAALDLPATAAATGGGVEDTVALQVIERLRGVYNELAEKHPDSAACRRIPLDFLRGEDFAAAVRARIDTFVKRGIPSLFSDLRPLLDNGPKAALVDAAARASLADAERDGDEPAKMWLQVYLAQHASYVGHTADAIARIAAAEASPGVASGGAASSRAAIDVYAAKASILAAAGDHPGAAAAADVARRLDPKDRFLNSVAARYLFRAGRLEDAKATALLFARDADEMSNNLFDMQVMWYELESGRAHMAAGDLGMALKMFTAVVAHFSDFQEDQYDFHMYCIRKVTLRAYLALLATEDRLYGHATFVDAATRAVHAYVRLHCDPPGRAAADAEAAQLSGMTEAQRKKFLDRKRKDAARAAKVASERLERDRATHNSKRNVGKFDEDPRGEKLLQTADPLKEAVKLIQLLKAHAAQYMATQEAAFEVALLQDKPFLALLAVKCAVHIDREASESHCMLVRFVQWLGGRKRPIVLEGPAAVLCKEVEALTGGSSAKELNERYRARHVCNSISALLAAAQMQAHLEPTETAAAAEALAAIDLSALREHPVEACEAAYRWLRDDAKHADAAGKLFAAAQQIHRWSSVFDGPERVVGCKEGVDAVVQRIQRLIVQ